MAGLSQLFQSASQALGITLPSNVSRSLNRVTSQLGLEGGLGERLSEQVAGETDEMKKKRMRDQMTSGLGGGASYDLFGGGLGGMGGLSY